MSALGVKQTLGVAANELEDCRSAEAKENSEKHLRRRAPKYLTVPPPAHVECLIYEGRDPHERQHDDECHGHAVYGPTLASDELV